ncbi:nucleoside phosphorylase domain-containing protein [Aspergillus karnatakaensis]|uniref:nucleoside phosphorylase domain-containing protein n=1 Tax=Aspergillus karnatakaensis TaxID=1810916 RepID=UPI003CCDEBC6
MQTAIALSHRDYTVGIICALSIELAAVRALLDEVYADLPSLQADDNHYILGHMCSHNVVISCLPLGVYGAISAATVATRMLSTFKSIRFGLMVGIGGGVPNNQDIRLGAVVVSMPTGHTGGVIQFDANFERTSTLNSPPMVLLNALARLRADHIMNGNRIPEFLSEMRNKYPLMRNSISPGAPDRLYRGDYHHVGQQGCCDHCNEGFLVTRPPRSIDYPRVHYGLIACSTHVMYGVSCIEMEAAGLMDRFPCLVIRGFSDYADSHKNDHWRGVASASAACYTKELLSVIPPEEVETVQRVSQLYPRL